ncbi:MAG: serine/threonine-protein phosphatase [Firmicutes bacterium]|nr:serine/threonine-protein phosphatase [Bacillota bacterium]
MIGMIDAACGSHVGKIRENNEDNFYFSGGYLEADNLGTSRVVGFQRMIKSGTCLAVFDGMGGGDNGEVASFEAAASVEELLKTADSYDSVHEFLESLCLIMNQKVFDKQRKLKCTHMGSTVAGLYVYKDYMYSFNLGDSRVYCVRDNQLMQVSQDHTDAAHVKAHNINRRPRLTQHLGIDPEMLRLEPYIVKLEMKRGDRFLICSDGLTDMLSNEDILRIMLDYNSSEKCTEALIEAALEKGGRDNVTVILAKIH